jgi:hypothetical protein
MRVLRYLTDQYTKVCIGKGTGAGDVPERTSWPAM